jgi:hypothetical protein
MLENVVAQFANDCESALLTSLLLLFVYDYRSRSYDFRIYNYNASVVVGQSVFQSRG